MFYYLYLTNTVPFCCNFKKMRFLFLEDDKSLIF